MNPWLVFKSQWLSSWLGMLALSLILGLSLSLGPAVSMVERGIRQGAAKAGDDFDLLIGAPGSAAQLILSAVYLQPDPLPLLSGQILEDLRQTPGVAWAAPLAFGDRWKNFPLVGTSVDMITLGGKRTLAEGTPFAEHGEAVVGALVPLSLGEEFSPAHGMIVLPGGNSNHDHIHYETVGRLPYTGSPWDSAILINIQDVWAAHGLYPGEGAAGISAVVVKPTTVADAYKLRSQWQSETTLAAFTGEVLTSLFATLGDVRSILEYMALLSQGIALGGVILATMFAVALRRDMLALLRTLGAPRSYVLCSVWGLAAAIVVLGVLVGLVLAFIIALAAAAMLQQETGTSLAINLSKVEWQMAALFMLVGFAAAATPALTAYRKAKNLSY